MTPKVGRNDPCPCGSGRKFKKCHLLEDPVVGMVTAPLPVAIPAAAQRQRAELPRVKKVTHFNLKKVEEAAPCACGSGKSLAECPLLGIRRSQAISARIDAERRDREAKFGEIRDVIHMNFSGYKFVAVGSELHYAPESEMKTFPDFLMRYIATILTPDWGKAEIRKPLKERHIIMQWYDALCRQQKQFAKGADGLLAFEPDGPSMAYMLLAYDLYVLRHHGALQKRVVERLKKPDQFQGARYELFTTATCIRAGFDIQHEKEKNRSETHPEFIGVHQHTGQRIALEAKSRHRPGVLGFRPGWPADPSPKAGVKDLVLAALEKDVQDPLVVFVDVNLPPAEPNLPQEPWFREVVETVTSEFGLKTEDPEPFNLLVFTNQPHHYGAPGSPTPERSTLNCLSKRPRRPAKYPEAILRISEEAPKWGLIPNEFPSDPRK